MAQKMKMLTCTCGNTELEKIGVRLHLSKDENGKSLPLVALMCRGSGCGRVTFRPDETAKAGLEEELHAHNGHPKMESPKTGSSQTWSPRSIAALFERIYTERLVYKAIAERDPNCPKLFAALKENREVCSSIGATFGQVYKRIEANEDLLAALESLPSIARQG